MPHDDVMSPAGIAEPAPHSSIFIVSGPGGVGKGTIVRALVQRDPRLWLSRSWTTRHQRPGESPDAYVFTSRDAFQQRVAAGGFLEWTTFLENFYGTPVPDALAGRDTVLEIEVDGARQVKALHPDAVLIFVLPPSREEQKRRLQVRGDPDHHVEQRVRKAEIEEPIGREMADHIVVNDDLERTVDEMLAIIDHHRASRPSSIRP
jgi:guanylate kinase